MQAGRGQVRKPATSWPTRPTELPARSVEYGSYIIEALETGRTFKLNGNVINDGMITNLPADCCAEGPIYVDRTGLHKTFVGDLPSQCAALNMTNINVQRLTVEAAMSGDPEKIVHACALDPLTGAVLTLKEIREMVDGDAGGGGAVAAAVRRPAASAHADDPHPGRTSSRPRCRSTRRWRFGRGLGSWRAESILPHPDPRPKGEGRGEGLIRDKELL